VDIVQNQPCDEFAWDAQMIPATAPIGQYRKANEYEASSYRGPPHRGIVFRVPFIRVLLKRRRRPNAELLKDV
jgi:hypothetical protein